nr:MAP7 domain-containing protein 1-like [Aegilops tauschii subsp. strangulata]
MPAAEDANLVNEISGLKLEGSWSFGKRPYSRADPPPVPASYHLKQIYMSEATTAIVGAGGDYEPDRAVSDVDDPDLGAAALEDTATGGVYEAGGSEEGDIETWPDDDEEEEEPRPAQGTGRADAGPSLEPSARGGTCKRKQGAVLFGSAPKKAKNPTAATRRKEDAAKAAKYQKLPKAPPMVSAAPLSLEKSAAGSIVGSEETSTTTRGIDPAADLREARERNAREVREEQEAARLEKAEADKAEAAALKKLAEAEAATAAKKQAEEAARR